MAMSLEELVSIVGCTVTLKQIGKELFRGLCPFHKERTPSFNVYQGRRGEGRYHCQGCGADGDGIDWLRKVEKKTFREAGGTSLSQEIRKDLEAKKRRERKLAELYDRQPECVIPDWGIET